MDGLKFMKNARTSEVTPRWLMGQKSWKKECFIMEKIKEKGRKMWICIHQTLGATV